MHSTCTCVNKQTRSLRDDLLKRNNDILVKMQHCLDLSEQLHETKDSARKIIKLFNLSLKTSAYVVAQTIAEMRLRCHLQSIHIDVGLPIDRF